MARLKQQSEEENRNAVNRAFSKQAPGYDTHDENNRILSDMRSQVYAHVSHYLKPASMILELNAGTGLDAAHFANQGHQVVATDLADGMVDVMREKITTLSLKNSLKVLQLSYDNLNELQPQKFDYVFSNFGGLNCIRDLSHVTTNLPALLKPNAHVTWVVMPPIYFWELLGVFKGNFRGAFRRMRKNGTIAHLEGEYFKTYYHTVSDIQRALGPHFILVASESLCVISPPPYRIDFPSKYPTAYRILRKLDLFFRNWFPFNRTGDHVIVTFRRA